MLPLRTISWHILEKYHATILTKYDTQKQFYKIELIHSATLYDADTLYLCLNPDELGKSLPMPKNACYVLSAFEFPAPFLTLQIAGQVDLLELYADLSNLLNQELRLSSQINTIASRLHYNLGLQDILLTAEKCLGGPIGICNPSYDFIANTPSLAQIPYGITTSQGHSFLSEKEIKSLQHYRFESKLYQLRSAFPVINPERPDKRWGLCPIYIKNVMAGYVAVAFDHTPSDYELRLITALAEICSLEMQKHDFLVSHTRLKYEMFLLDLLEGKFQDLDIIHNRLTLLEKKFYRFFCIIVLKCTEPHDSNLFNRRQMENLRRYYTNSMSVVHDDSIVLFLNQDTPIVQDHDFVKIMEAFAARNNMHIGISQPFADTLKIKYFYAQAKNVISLCETMNLSKNVFLAEEHLPVFLFQHCDEWELESTIHHHIHALYEYDNEFHTEFIMTLRAYLQNDRNAAKTAAMLHIHRSTFFYRFKKIEELLGISLSDSRLLFLYELSFKIWDYVSK